MNTPAFLTHFRSPQHRATAEELFKQYANYQDPALIVRGVLEDCFTNRRTNSDVYGAIIGQLIKHGPDARAFASQIVTATSEEVFGIDMTHKVVIHCDGLCEPNPHGVMAYAFIVFDPPADDDNAMIAYQESAAFNPSPNNTNNVAEYVAIGKALAWLEGRKHLHPALIRSDSQVVVNQINGVFAVHEPTLKRLHARATELMQATGATLEWVRRNHPKQQEVDALGRRAVGLRGAA